MDDIEIKNAELQTLTAEALKLERINDDLKSGILSSLWLDEAPGGGFTKYIPSIISALNLILLVILLIKK